MALTDEISKETQDGLGRVVSKLFEKIGDPLLDFLLKPIYKCGHVVSNWFDRRRQQKHYRFELANKLVHTFLANNDVDMIIFSPHNGRKDLRGKCFMFTSCRFYHIRKDFRNEFLDYLINPDISMPFDDNVEWWSNCRNRMVAYKEHFDLEEQQFFAGYEKVQFLSFGIHYILLFYRSATHVLDRRILDAIEEQLQIFIN